MEGNQTTIDDPRYLSTLDRVRAISEGRLRLKRESPIPTTSQLAASRRRDIPPPKTVMSWCACDEVMLREELGSRRLKTMDDPMCGHDCDYVRQRNEFMVMNTPYLDQRAREKAEALLDERSITNPLLRRPELLALTARLRCEMLTAVMSTFIYGQPMPEDDHEVPELPAERTTVWDEPTTETT